MISYICKDEGITTSRDLPSWDSAMQKWRQHLICLRGIPTFVAHAVYSEMEETADFTCGNVDVNQLVWIVNGVRRATSVMCRSIVRLVREQRGQEMRDFMSMTGLMLMDSYNVYRKWLAQCRYGQYPEGIAGGKYRTAEQ